MGSICAMVPGRQWAPVNRHQHLIAPALDCYQQAFQRPCKLKQQNDDANNYFIFGTAMIFNKFVNENYQLLFGRYHLKVMITMMVKWILLCGVCMIWILVDAGAQEMIHQVSQTDPVVIAASTPAPLFRDPVYKRTVIGEGNGTSSIIFPKTFGTGNFSKGCPSARIIASMRPFSVSLMECGACGTRMKATITKHWLWKAAI